MYQQEYSQPQPLYYQQTSSSVPLVASTPNNPNQVKPGGVEPVLVLLLNFVFPGLGHIVMGQDTKGIAYVIINFIMAFVIVLLCFVFIGICLIPFQIIWFVMIMIDGYVMAQRLQEGIPVMKGECWSSITTFGVSLFEKGPVFVTGSQ